LTLQPPPIALETLQRQVSTALAYHQRGDLVMAQKLYRDILQRTPRCFDALHLLGVATADLGAVDAGIELIRQAIALDPSQANARYSLAQALLAQGDHAAALASLNDATALHPVHADAWFLRGNVLQLLERLDEAVDSYERAIAIRAVYPEAFNNLAAALRALRRTARALECAEQAITQRPNYAKAFNNRGLILLDAGRGTAAVESFRQALAIEPRFAEALHNMGTAWMQLHRFTEASAAFAELASLAPDFRHVRGNLLHARMSCCNWTDYRPAAATVTLAVERDEHADVPLSFMAISESPAAQLRCAQIYTRAFYPRLQRTSGGRRNHPDSPRLRIGYLSSDFRDHPVAQLTAGLIESHDRSRFETFGFCAASDDGSEWRRRLGAAFEQFEEVGTMSDAALAERIAALELDILVDLGGHTFGSRTRVLAYRPAAVQISFLGFPGTLGAEFVDYVIADRWVIPEAERRHYAEQVIYLPDSYLPTDFAPAPPPPSKAAAGLPENAFVFCGFNAPYKLTPEVFDSWMRVLHAVPAAILWLREGSGTMQSNLAREAGARGVDPARLIYAPRVASVHEHRARFALADVFLDTTPYNAHTTAGEALAATVPVITRRGRTFASRVATSLLQAVDLGHLSVEDPVSYERLAIELAHSPPALAALKAHLRRVRNCAPLFDIRRFCRHLEQAFLEVADRRRRGEPPHSLLVAPQS
jgi:protein O-GlcNAc transferase